MPAPRLYFAGNSRSLTLRKPLVARSIAPSADTAIAPDRSDKLPSRRRLMKVAAPLTVTRGAVSDWSLPLVTLPGSTVPISV